MNIEKPDTLNLSAQPLDWQGRLHQSFTVSLGFDLQSGALLPANTVWAAAIQALPPGACMDMGVPKKTAEWLLAGQACAPEGTTASALTVDIRVGPSRRRFLVSSEQPVPFMPLDWSQTWGTTGENPEGLKPSQMRRAPLSDAALPFGTPACPGPRGVWPCRMQKMGRYDAAWLKTRWPGLPDDFDWTFYNLAQPAQFLPGGLRGDEEIELVNLHPALSRIKTRLPGKTLHIFAGRAAGESELAATADTLWLFPNQLAGLLFWHAMTPSQDESGTDILNLRLVLEPEDETPEAGLAASGAGAEEAASGAGAEDAAAAGAQPTGAPLAARVGLAAARVAGAAATLSQSKEKTAQATAKPGTSAAHSASAPKATVEAARAAQATARPETSDAHTASGPQASAAPAHVKASGEAVAPPVDDVQTQLWQDLDDSLDEINAGLREAGYAPLNQEQIAETRRHLANMARQIQELRVKAAEPPPELAEVLRQAGVPEERIKAVQTALDLELPDPASCGSAAEWEAAVERYVQDFSRVMQPSEEVKNTLRTGLRVQGPGGDKVLERLAGGPPPTPVEQLVKAGMAPDRAAALVEALDADIPPGDEGMLAYARSLEKAGGFPAGSVADRIAAYQKTLRQIRAGTPEAAALDREGKVEEDAERGRADQRSGPAVQERNSAGERAGTSSAPEATAAAAPQNDRAPQNREEVIRLLASGGSLAGLQLSGLDLSGLDLSGQDMQAAALAGCNLSGAQLDGADLSACQLAGANLQGASLAGANLEKADLKQAKAAQASFAGAKLLSAKLAGMSAPDADFSEATLSGADLSGGNFSAASFHKAQAAGVQARQANFSEARIHFSELADADFSGANLNSADIHASGLDRAQFQKACLDKASFCSGTKVSGANFAGASLQDASWTQVQAAGAVFAGVQAKGAILTDSDFSATDWSGANAVEADFSRSQLQGARLEHANLFQAALRESGLAAADLRRANLYGADLCRAGLQADTRLDGADYTNTILAAQEKV